MLGQVSTWNLQQEKATLEVHFLGFPQGPALVLGAKHTVIVDSFHMLCGKDDLWY